MDEKTPGNFSFGDMPADYRMRYKQMIEKHNNKNNNKNNNKKKKKKKDKEESAIDRITRILYSGGDK